MKKIIVYSLLIILSLFITGCKNNKYDVLKENG